MSIATRDRAPAAPPNRAPGPCPPGTPEWPRAITDRVRSDARFRQATDRGNQAYAAGDLNGARPHYDAALAEAEAVFQSARGRGGAEVLVAPMMLNIACQNLAALADASGDWPNARRLTLRAIEGLIGGMEDPACPIAMRINCARHLGYALPMLADPADPPTALDRENAALAERARVAAVEVVRVAALLGASVGPGRDAASAARLL